MTSCFHSIGDRADKDLSRMFGDGWNRFVSVCVLQIQPTLTPSLLVSYFF